jgi:hypothetical protein
MPMPSEAVSFPDFPCRTGKYEKAVPGATDFYHSRKLDIVQTDHVTPGKHSPDLFRDRAISSWRIAGRKIPSSFPMDICPTLCDLLGADIPEGANGFPSKIQNYIN